jgi:hypothetical protein
MDVDSPASKGKNKRTASDASPPAAPPPSTSTVVDTSPRILLRHQHRRRNVAAAFWGPEIGHTPTPTPLSAQPTNSAPAPFNIYKALLRHPNLFFQFALRLPYTSIIDLYAIDKEFHYRLNKYSVSLIHDYARYHAPLAGYIFSWVLHPEVCISDPMLRPMDGREWLARDVPGFRWVGMILHRQKVVRGILTMLGLEGHRVPKGVEGALMKFWAVMEMKETKLRLSFLRDREIWADADIILFQLFLVKLDMRFEDAVLGNGLCGLGHMLLCQKSLSVLWRVLSGKTKLRYDETTDMIVKTYINDELDLDNHGWLDDEVDNNVPEEQWGLLSLEGWDEGGEKMDTAVDMVIMEGARRGLNVHQYLLDFVLYGWVDRVTGENLPLPKKLRRDKRVVVPREGWPGKEERVSIIKGLDIRFGLRKTEKQIMEERKKEEMVRKAMAKAYGDIEEMDTSS